MSAKSCRDFIRVLCVLLGAACHGHRTLVVATKINQKMSLSSSAKYLATAAVPNSMRPSCDIDIAGRSISGQADPSRVRLAILSLRAPYYGVAMNGKAGLSDVRTIAHDL